MSFVAPVRLHPPRLLGAKVLTVLAGVGVRRVSSIVGTVLGWHRCCGKGQQATDRAVVGRIETAQYSEALDREFWQYLRDTRIPTPLALLRRFHDQPQAWDFTQFVLFRCYSARQPSLIPWLELLEQLGLAPSHPRRLRQVLAGVLATIRGQYADFPAHFLPGSAGLEVQPWRMPMSE